MSISFALLKTPLFISFAYFDVTARCQAMAVRYFPVSAIKLYSVALGEMQATWKFIVFPSTNAVPKPTDFF